MKILSLLWHSVESNSINPEYHYGFNPTKSLFKEQIEFIVDNYTPISIFDFEKILEDNNLLKSYIKPPVLLGFDDGFKNVINHALPILNKYEIPALFFIIGEVIRNDDFVPWYIEIKHLVRRTKKKSIIFKNTNFELTTKDNRVSLMKFLETFFMKYKLEKDRQTFLNNLSELLEIDRPLGNHLDEDHVFANKNDLFTLEHNSLMTVSSHSMTHNLLANLTRREQIYELEKSNSILSEYCPTYYPVIAYPNGSFNQNTINIAKGIYKFGFAVFFGSSFNNFYAYPRINMQPYNVEKLKYFLNPLRLKLLLPIKKFLHNSRLRTIR